MKTVAIKVFCFLGALLLLLTLILFVPAAHGVVYVPSNDQDTTKNNAELHAMVKAQVEAILKEKGKAETDKKAAALTPDTKSSTSSEPADLSAGQYLLVLSPLLLHLCILFWVWNSKMSLKEALDDKEEINKAANRAQASVNQEANRVHELRSQVLNNSLSQPLSKTLLTSTGAQVSNMPGGVDIEGVVDADIKARDQIISRAFAPAQINHAPNQGLMGAEAGSVVGSGTTGTGAITSVSRLIVFLSGYASVAISTCLASFIIYRGLAEPAKELPNLNGLLMVLLSLGIGIIPYAVNRITTATEAQKT